MESISAVNQILAEASPETECLYDDPGTKPPDFMRVNSSEPPKGQDDQINYFDHLDRLAETKDLAANMTKPIHSRQAESSAAGYYGTKRHPHRIGQTVVIAK